MTDKQNDEIWVTEDGTKIAVGNLSEEHAKNILRMILRTTRERDDFIRNTILPGLMEKLREEHGPDVQIAGLEVNGVSMPLDSDASIDDAFDRAGARGPKLH
jgi:hypothetical protein